MSVQLSQWKASGSFMPFGPFQHQVFIKELGSSDAQPDDTLLLIHGFPESSYSYHAVVDGLMKHFQRIILFDLIGYGWSDKPKHHYSYSLFEQADVALTVWKHFGIQGGHLLAHDMGDSVATELLARHEHGLLPQWFSKGFKSITFTNGSMVLDLAQLRTTQKILLSRFGPWMGQLTRFQLFQQQIRSAHGNNRLSEENIYNLWAGNTLQDGHKKSYLTIKYLNDRKRFEKTRWLPALGQTQLPIHLCWGNEDAVARVEMAHYLKNEVCKNAQLTIMEGLGHFCQLGSPEQWTEHILDYFKMD